MELDLYLLTFTRLTPQSPGGRYLQLLLLSAECWWWWWWWWLL